MVYTDLCSFYFSVFDEHAVDMTLKEFVKLLRGERWKVQVEEYQRLKASGRETEAKKLKRKLAALVIAGRCDGSHAETNLKQWSGDAMLDVDKCNGRVSEFLQVLKDTPWVKAAWRSVSYDGLKLVVRVEAESVDEYRMAYALVAWHVAQLLAFPCDMSCKNPTRPCFASYDPEAFFRPDTEVFPWRRFVTEHPDRVGEILAELKVKTPASASKPPVAASGMLHTFFNEFLEQNPFVDGKKNEFLLKLGRIARYKGVGEEELARLKTLAVERLAGMGCAAGDIPPRIDSGYRYADMNKGPETPASRAHKAQGSLRRFSEPRFTGLSILTILFLNDLIIHQTQQITFHGCCRQPGFIGSRHQLRIGELARHFFQNGTQFEKSLYRPDSSGSIIHGSGKQQTVFQQHIHYLHCRMEILIRTLPLRCIPLRLTLTQCSQHHGNTRHHQSVAQHNGTRRIIIFRHYLTQIRSETLRMLFPLFLGENHLGRRSGEKDKHTQQLLAHPFEISAHIQPGLAGICRLILPVGLSHIESHTAVHSILQRRNKFMQLGGSTRSA